MQWSERGWAGLAVLTSLSASVASAQSGAAVDVRRPKPVVMLLVDTSGSMERMPGLSTTETTDDFPRCTGNPAVAGSERNRWAVTLEALTGTFQSYSCRQEVRESSAPNMRKYDGEYDEGYYLPHYNFTSDLTTFNTVATQDTDGVVDAYSQRLKFGLMTFDGVNTTLGGPTLVPFAEFESAGPFQTAVAEAPGIYSYGRTGRLAFPNCVAYGVNSGARNKDAPTGGLIAVADDGPDITLVNENVQRALLAVRPFGGTPTAAMLDDLKYFLEHDDSVRTGGRDPYAACRPRYAILITDGVPDKMFRDSRFQCQSAAHASCAEGVCECPYETEPTLAAELRTSNLVDKLIVVAFDVDAETKTALDEIAQAGGRQDAIAASSPAALRNELDEVLSELSGDFASRSVPQIVSNGLPAHAGGRQYEITAGFRVGFLEDSPWEGVLYRRRYGCDTNSQPEALPLEENQGDLFHKQLEAQSRAQTRVIKTIRLSTTGRERATIRPVLSITRPSQLGTHNDLAPTGTFGTLSLDSSTNAALQDGESTSYSMVEFQEASLPAALFGDADGNSRAGEASDLRKIVNYVRALPSERERALADIYHSNPVVLPPLTVDSSHLSSSDQQLSNALRKLMVSSPDNQNPPYGVDGRPGVVFVGTNDGVLHAFNLDTWHDGSGNPYEAGHEFWGFVPPALFSKLASAATPTHQEMFDGTPVVREMLLSRGNSTNVREGKFATVLLAAVRGAPAYVALDVTTPHAPPKFLWQFSAAAMGNTVATPALTQAIVAWDDVSQPEERAIAILPGGTGREAPAATCTSRDLVVGKTRAANPTNNRDKVRCWEHRGRSLYVVDVATGQLLQEFDPQHFPSPLTGSVVVDGEGLNPSRAAYFTDHDGVLWRLSMLDPNPKNWLVEPIYDVFHGERVSLNGYRKGRPSLPPPLLSRDRSGNYVIMVGTGDVDNLVEQQNVSDPIQHRVLSLLEKRTVRTHTSSAKVFGGSVEANWEWPLQPGESVTGPLSLFEKVLYFGTFVSSQNGNACEMGLSRLWGLDYMQAQGTKEPVGRWRIGTDTQGNPAYERYEEDAFNDSLVLGISIAQEPVCISKLVTDSFAPSGRVAPDAKINGGNYRIRAMVSGQAGEKVGRSELGQFSQTLMITNEARAVGFGGSIE